MKKLNLWLLCWLVPAAAVATTLVPHTLLQRAEQSDRVALVQVLNQRVEETPNAQFPLKTYTTVAVGTDLRGGGPRELTVVQIGGRLGLQSMEIPGDAKFKVGETAVVFLRCRLSAVRCHLVAMGAGKLEVAGDKVLVPDLNTGKSAWRTLSQLTAEVAIPGVAR